MDEYIKRADAINARGRSCNRKCAECDFAIDGDSWCEGEVFVVDLLRIPAADVQPVVKARWSEYEDELFGETIKTYCCSNCHHLISRTTIIRNFCPNCGAMMEES